MSKLFSPFTLRDITFKNRVFVSPMCEYSSADGIPNDWHFVHLGSRAVGGAALVIVEATAITAKGRISPGDTGIWSDDHVAAFGRVTRFIKDQGSIPGIQLAHAGRKASTGIPWENPGALTAQQGAWPTLGPSPIPFDKDYPAPREMTAQDIDAAVNDFTAAAHRALAAGFQVVEIHMAHGYLLHEFLSPLSNHRTDEYGGSLENRMRFPLRVARAVREAFPNNLPVFVRISATDWADGGWDLAQSIEFSKALKQIGIDLIDCSTGGLLPHVKIPLGPGYQVPFADGVRKHAGIATGAVGLITEPQQAEEIIASGKADVVLLARELLRDPYWPLHAAAALGVDITWPNQYGRAKSK